MTYKGKWPGTYAAICDVCGFRFPSDKLKKRWDGLMTCDSDWETKHPQLFIKVPQETIAPPWVRPKEVYQFIDTCTVITSSGKAGLGTAGCAKAGNSYLPPNY